MNTLPNKHYHKFINRCTAWYIYMVGHPRPSFLIPSVDIEPVWVTGMFRSGTTLLSRILERFQADFGPVSHRLGGVGYRGHLNPAGFWENYIFMEWSTFLLRSVDSWGDLPLSEDIVLINPTEIDYSDFTDHAIRYMHDDRLSNMQKVRVIKKYFPGNLDVYLSSEWRGRPFVKNPHFCLMQAHLDIWFPHGKFVVIFKEPTAAIRSASKVSPRVDKELYTNYYRRFLKHPNAILVSYEHLISDPINSCRQLAKALDLQFDALAVDLIDVGHNSQNGTVGTDSFHQALCLKSING